MWNQLPEKYGKWNSVYRAFNRWSHSGFMTEILKAIEELEEEEQKLRALDGSHCKAHQDACRSPYDPLDQGLGKTKGGRNTKISAVVNSYGKAVNIAIVPGNLHDSKCAQSTLGEDLGDCYVLADKAYDSKEIREFVELNNGIPNIPSRKNAKEPAPYDKELGKSRHIVECYFARIKRYRRVATRFDKLSATYLAFVTLASLADWMEF